MALERLMALRGCHVSPQKGDIWQKWDNISTDGGGEGQAEAPPLTFHKKRKAASYERLRTCASLFKLRRTAQTFVNGAKLT